MQNVPPVGEPAIIKIQKHETIEVSIHIHDSALPIERAYYIELFANFAEQIVKESNKLHFQQKKGKPQLLSGLAGVPPYNVDTNYRAKAILKELGYRVD